jgi:parvulin-like peptidyl-prolyl isomerase
MESLLSRSRTVRGVIVFAISSVVLVACTSGPAGPLATVDDVEITREQLEGWVRVAVQGNPDIDAVGLQTDLLSRVIQQRVIDAALAARGLAVDPATIAEVRASIEDQVGGPLSLTATLADIGYPPDFFDDVFVPVEAAIETLVLSLADGLTLETRTARHILVDTAEEADEVFALLQAGADFAELAIERSQDPGSGSRGGDLGPQQRGVFVPPFDDAVWSARTGVVLAPVESDFGFHVIEVTAIDRSVAADLSPDQRRRLVAAELEAVISAAFAAARVSVDPTIGKWDPISGTVRPV